MDEYTVVINGIEHTMLLDPDHAKAIGATKVAAPAPAPAAAPAAAPAKAKTPANKARQAKG